MVAATNSPGKVRAQSKVGMAPIATAWLSTISTTALVLLAGAVLDAVRLDSSPSSGVVVAILAAVLVRGLAAGSSSAFASRAAARIERSVRRDIFERVLHFGTPLRSRARTGAIVSMATEGAETLSNYRGTFIGPMIASMTSPLLVIAAVAIFIDAWSAFALFIAVPLIPGLVRQMQKRFASVSERYRASSGRLSAQFLDALQGLPTLKMFNRGQAHGETIARETESLRRQVMKLLAANQVVLLVVDSLFWLGMVTLAALLAMVRLRSGAISAGQAIALVLLGVLLVEPLEKVGQFFYIGMSGRAAAKEIDAFLAAEQVEAPPADLSDRSDGSISFENVYFAYEGERAGVLEGLTFAVDAGERVVLVGASGAGKSTVANLVQALISPSSGRILIGGHDVTRVPVEWVRSQVASVAQNTYLFTGTVRSNLLIAKPSANEDELWEGLAAVQLDSMVRGLTGGLDASIGERGLTLSGGEAQRIAVARALLKDAPTIVLDEPTSNVDLESEALIIAALERLTRGKTVLLISHRASAVTGVDRTVELVGGVVSAAVQART